MADRSLAGLDPKFRPFAEKLLAKAVEAGLPVMIVCTSRTQAEQDEAKATGHSQVDHSKHQDGLAIDICPYDTWNLHGPDKLKWDTTDPVWWQLGKLGEDLGLRWGGRFGQSDPAKLGWDPGHFELKTGG